MNKVIQSIEGYTIIRSLSESSNSIIYRALKNEGNTPVIIKLLQPESPTSKDIKGFKRECEISNNNPTL